MAPLNISLTLGLLLGVVLLPNADACWPSGRRERKPETPKEYDDGGNGHYPFSPDAWEIEAIANKKFKPHVNKLKNKLKYINSTGTGKPCFGNGEEEYRLVTENKLLRYSAKIFMFQAIREHLNEVADQYLSKYCKDYNKCEVNAAQNNYICVKSSEETTKTHGAGKSLAQVLKYLKFYLFSQYKKYYRMGGETEFESEKIDTGKACVKPPYKLPFDKRPTQEQQEKMDKIGSEYLGVFCKSDKCNYDFKSKKYICGSSSAQPIMALPVALLLVTSGLLNSLFS